MPRRALYKPEFASQALKFCLLGATDAQLGEFFGVSEKSVRNWAKKYPDFREACFRGKAVANANVAASLYQRAVGYSCRATKVFCVDGKIITHDVTQHFPPDTGAAAFWLKNRCPEDWKDRVEHTGRDNGPIEFTMATPRDIEHDDIAEGADDGAAVRLSPALPLPEAESGTVLPLRPQRDAG